MKETVSNKNDLFNLPSDAFTFAGAADCVSFKCHSLHFHIQKTTRGFKYVVGARDPKSTSWSVVIVLLFRILFCALGCFQYVTSYVACIETGLCKRASAIDAAIHMALGIGTLPSATVADFS